MNMTWNHLSPIEQAESLARPAQANSQSLSEIVSGILTRVKVEGDDALLALTAEFDGAQLTSLALSERQRQTATDELPNDIKQAIQLAYSQIFQFHQAQKTDDVTVETIKGVVCELHNVPLDSVGLYIPGGTAPLPSTVLMLGATAQVAGCQRKVLCTPPNAEGEIAKEIIYAASLCDIDEIYLVGGAQAIAAMAYGTESIAQVDKIYGPGNSFVTEAKQQVSTDPAGAAIDMPAGPSEVLVIADKDANPAFVASDLLSQAEHGKDSQAVLVSDSQALIEATQGAVNAQLAELSRQDIASVAMKNSRYILTDSLSQSIEVSNRYAPEHLIVQTSAPRDCLPYLKNAGSIFLGAWSPESAGDYASGTNHVLPTYGYSRNYSSLGLADFCRRFTVQELSQDGLKALGNCIMTLADAEGLDAHKNAVAIRLAAMEKNQ